MHKVQSKDFLAPSVVKSTAFFYLCAMISPEWKRSLRRRAGQHGMCEDKRHALEQMRTTLDAVSLYIGSAEWALGENYPTLEEIRKNFTAKELGEYGIYIDREFNGERFYGKHKYIFHNCRGTIYTGLNKELKIVPMLYFANGCDMSIRSFQPSIVSPVRISLYVYGNCHIDGEVSKDLECVTYKRAVK